MNKQKISDSEMMVSFANGRISASDCSRLSAFLAMPDVKAVSVRPCKDNVAVLFQHPHGKKTLPQICCLVSQWCTNDPIIVRAYRQNAHTR